MPFSSPEEKNPVRRKARPGSLNSYFVLLCSLTCGNPSIQQAPWALCRSSPRKPALPSEHMFVDSLHFLQFRVEIEEVIGGDIGDGREIPPLLIGHFVLFLVQDRPVPLLFIDHLFAQLFAA